jgi:hypothetical protein
MIKASNEQVIARFKAVQGNRYDYSKISFVNKDSKVTILCKEHGEFAQTPATHWKGGICPSCMLASRRDKVVADFRSIHGDLYDYSNVIYVNSQTKVRIICPKHGEFEQNIAYHKSGRICPHCTGFKVDDFTRKAREVHGDKYDYSESIYTESRKPIKIKCSIHGVFITTPNSHISVKRVGCPDCRSKKVADSQRGNAEDFIKRAREVHGDSYTYDEVVYVNARLKVKIKCPIHGVFEQPPDTHINSRSGCNACAITGFNPEKPAILYRLFVESPEGKFEKIGITNTMTVFGRYNMAEDKERILDSQAWSFELGADASKLEREIVEANRNNLYVGGKVILKGAPGNAELFTEPVTIPKLPVHSPASRKPVVHTNVLQPNQKRCSVCSVVKSSSEFGKRAKLVDGHRSQCKLCDYKYNAKRIEKETPDERENRLAKKHKINKTQEMWEAELAKGREYRTKKLAEESHEEKKVRLANGRKSRAEKLDNESPEEQEKRSNYHREYRFNQTPEEKSIRKAKSLESAKRIAENRTPDEHEAFKARKREERHKRLANEPPEKREVRLAKRRSAKVKNEK